jgi:hypothetical protein
MAGAMEDFVAQVTSLGCASMIVAWRRFFVVQVSAPGKSEQLTTLVLKVLKDNLLLVSVPDASQLMRTRCVLLVQEPEQLADVSKGDINYSANTGAAVKGSAPTVLHASALLA